MKILMISFLAVILGGCNSLPLKGGLDILGDIAKVGKHVPNPGNLAKAVPNVAKVPRVPSVRANIGLPRLGLSAPNLRLVNTLPTSARMQVMRPPRFTSVTRIRGVRPIRVSAPYSMSVKQRRFTRLGTRGLSRVNAAHPSARAGIMEQVLADLLRTPYILAQPASVRRSLRRGTLTARWQATYSLYGYPVGVPYYYSERERRKRERDEAEYYRRSEEARNARISLIQLQLFLESIMLNTGLIHVRDGRLLYGNLVVPEANGRYVIEMVDGPGTVGITGKAVRHLRNKRLSIVGHNGINNIILEPNLLKDMDVKVRGNNLKFGGSTLQVKGVENLFIGPKVIDVANIDHVDNHMVEKQIKTALAKADNQPLFKNY